MKDLPSWTRAESAPGDEPRDFDDASLAEELDPGAARFPEQRVAHVPRAVGRGKQLSGLLFEDERNPEIFGKKLRDRFETPGLQQIRREARHRRDEELGREPGGEHVAAAAAGDQDLLAGIVGGFQERDPGARAAGKKGGREAGGAGPDHENVYLLPDFPAFGEAFGEAFAAAATGRRLFWRSFQITTIGAAT